MSESRRNGSECVDPTAAEPSADGGMAPHAQAIIRFRPLPHGDFGDAVYLGWKGRNMEIDPQGQVLALGALLEIESECMLYLGEVCQRDGSVVSVRVEHTIDRAKLAADRDHWG